MIELPDGNWPRTASASFIDYGFLQRAAAGGDTKRINRKGSRYMASVSMGPFPPDTARQFIARLIAGKSEGLRIPYPLQVPQGGAGLPVVNGAAQTGTTLALRGMTQGYYAKEGYWLSIVDQNGRHYLHNVKTGGMADGSGNLSIVVSPELRWPFLDGATVNLDKPMVQGWVDGSEWAWQLSGDRVTPIEFSIEEAA